MTGDPPPSGGRINRHVFVLVLHETPPHNRGNSPDRENGRTPREPQGPVYTFRCEAQGFDMALIPHSERGPSTAQAQCQEARHVASPICAEARLSVVERWNRHSKVFGHVPRLNAISRPLARLLHPQPRRLQASEKYRISTSFTQISYAHAAYWAPLISAKSFSSFSTRFCIAFSLSCKRPTLKKVTFSAGASSVLP
jgi:hypothetical protein